MTAFQISFVILSLKGSYDLNLLKLAVEWVLRYLRGTIDVGLCYRKSLDYSDQLVGYCGSDFCGDFFTKTVSSIKFQRCKDLIGVTDLS